MPGKEAGSGCLCLFRMWRREDSDPGTGPECVRAEGAWVMTDPDCGDDRACWAFRLQLGPIMGLWDCGCCRGWVWGWCSGGWGCWC